MTTAEIKTWLSYWNCAKMVKISEIKSLADVALARKYCRCMSVGAFSNVSDSELWKALEQ